MTGNRPPRGADEGAIREWLLTASSHDIENWADIGLRHKSGVTPYDRLERFLSISRLFGGFATRDESWGEFEKHFSVMVKRLIILERENEKLKSHPVLALPVEGRCTWCGDDEITQATLYLCDMAGCDQKKGGSIESPEW